MCIRDRDLTEPLDLIKGLEERGAQYIVQSAGSPSITVTLTQAEKNYPYIAYLHPYWQKEFKKVLKPETVLIGSNYSVWGKGNKNLQMIDPQDNTMFKAGAKNIERGIVDMIGLGRQSFADPLLPKKLADGNEMCIRDRCEPCRLAGRFWRIARKGRGNVFVQLWNEAGKSFDWDRPPYHERTV